MKIKVLGLGCPTCKKLYENTMQATKELGINCEVEYVTDIQAMLDLGVISAPVLMINDEIASAGQMPSLEKIKQFIKEGEKSADSVDEKPNNSCGCCCGDRC
jgi:small redox-active disulfide protein 2